MLRTPNPYLFATCSVVLSRMIVEASLEQSRRWALFWCELAAPTQPEPTKEAPSPKTAKPRHRAPSLPPMPEGMRLN